MKTLFAILVILMLPAPLMAAESEQITVSSSAIGLTAATYADSVRAHCYVTGYALRWLTDASTDPTSSVGIYQAAASYFTLTSNYQLRTFKAIRVTSDATLDCQYWKAGEY